MTGDGRRARRVAETVREYLGRALGRDFDDKRLASLVVTGVEMPDDLGYARVSVRLLVGDDEPRERRVAMSALARVAGRLRRELGPILGLRRVPELRFEYDTGPDAARRVDELLSEIDDERRGRQ
jgi:ribosome-binding factor A